MLSKFSFVAQKLDGEEVRMFKEAGIIFEGAKKINIGSETIVTYSVMTLDVDDKATIGKISKLPWQMIDFLSRAIPDENASKKFAALAKRRIFEEQLIRGKDGLPLNLGEERAFTLDLDEMIPSEIARLKKELKKVGIDEVKVGPEMEFELEGEILLDHSKWGERKKEIIKKLNEEIKRTEGPPRDFLIEKCSAVKGFNAREIFMLDLIEHDPRTQGFFEQLFGKSGKNGYYDELSTLELKFQPADPLVLNQRRKIALDVLFEKASAWELKVPFVPVNHINLSFWKNGQNLFDDRHPEFSTTGKKIAEGITKILHDCTPVIRGSGNEQRGNLALTVDRENSARFASGRYEVRPTPRFAEESHPEFVTMIAMAGALWGLTANRSQLDSSAAIAQAKEVGNPVIHYNADPLGYISHVLGNSTLKEDGTLSVPEGYICRKAIHIAASIGIESKDKIPGDILVREITTTPPYADSLVNFLKQVTISKNKNGFQINWPMDENGSYEIVAQGVNMEKIPPEMQGRLRRGEKVSIKEMIPYLRLGASFPTPEKKLPFDVRPLENSVQCVDVRKALVIEPGYSYETPSSFPGGRRVSLQEANAMRMLKSRALKETLSPEFYGRLVPLIEQKFNVSAQSDSLANNLQASPAKSKWWRWLK